MINKLTRYDSGDEIDPGMLPCEEGDWVNFDKVKELLAEQEKKTNILLDALWSISESEHEEYGDCTGYCSCCLAQQALEEYKDVIEYFTSKGSKLPESCMMWKTSIG